MTELLQNLIDGLGRGSIYALLALGVAVVFGVMHLLNFAHGELITVSGYATFWAMGAGWSWYLIVALIVALIGPENRGPQRPRESWPSSTGTLFTLAVALRDC